MKILGVLIVVFFLFLIAVNTCGCSSTPDPKVVELAAQGVACNARGAAVIAQGKFLGHSCQENLLQWQVAMTTDPNCVAYMTQKEIQGVRCND